MARKKWNRPGTFEDPKAIKPELRTKPQADCEEKGISFFYEPVTVLRSDSSDLAVEIVRVRNCLGRDCRVSNCVGTGDCESHYEVRIVGYGTQAGTKCALSVKYRPGNPQADTYRLLQVLLEDAATFIEELEKDSS